MEEGTRKEDTHILNAIFHVIRQSEVIKRFTFLQLVLILGLHRRGSLDLFGIGNCFDKALVRRLCFGLIVTLEEEILLK